MCGGVVCVVCDALCLCVCDGGLLTGFHSSPCTDGGCLTSTLSLVPLSFGHCWFAVAPC